MARYELRSPVMGSFALQHFEDGAEVEEGESVLEIEAFKMFTGLVAPVSGVIHYHVALGELVGEDDLLATIETGG